MGQLNSTEDGRPVENMELAFEYLLTKDKLQWITISSDQVSVCMYVTHPSWTDRHLCSDSKI